VCYYQAVDRFKKKAVGKVTQNQKTVQCKVLTGSGRNVEDSSGYTVQCELLKDSGQTVECDVVAGSGQTVEDDSRQCNTQPTEFKVLGTDRQWTDCRRQHGHSDTGPTYVTV